MYRIILQFIQIINGNYAKIGIFSMNGISYFSFEKLKIQID